MGYFTKYICKNQVLSVKNEGFPRVFPAARGTPIDFVFRIEYNVEKKACSEDIMDSVFSRIRSRSRVLLGEGAVERVWFLCLLALVIPVYLGHFPLPPMAQYMIYGTSFCAYALLCMKLFLWDGWERRTLWLLGGCLVVLALGTAVSGNRCFLSSFLLACSAKGIRFDKISRFFFRFFLVTFLLNLLLVVLGLAEDTVTVRGEAWGYGNLRHSYGFGHPNTLGFWGMLTVFSGLLACPRGKRRFPFSLVLLVLSVVLFRLTDSKAALFSSLAAILLFNLFLLLGPYLTEKKWSVRFFPGVMLLCVVVFLLLCLLYRENSGFFRLCNTLFSQRLGYANQGFRLFGASLLGAHVDFGWDPVDSLLGYAPICLGVLPSLVYLGLALAAIYRAGRAGRYDIAAVAFAGLLYCTMEYGLINPVNLPLFAASACLSEANGRKPSV